MFTFSSSEQYESFCKDVFEEGRGFVDVQKYGRPGQRQHGIDLICYRPGPAARVGIQCKWYATVTPSLRVIIGKDIIAARAIDPPIVELIICVDANEDRDLTDLVAEHHANNVKEGLFQISVEFRDGLRAEAARMPNIIQKYLPQTYQAVHRAASETVQADFAQALVSGLQSTGLPLQADAMGLRPHVLASRIAACAELAYERQVAANGEVQDLIRSVEDAIAGARPEKALPLIALALDHNPTLSPDNRAALLKQQARAFSSCNRRAEAIESYERYLECQVNAPDAPACRAVIPWLKGDLDETIRLATQALESEGSAELALALLIDSSKSDAELETLLRHHAELLNTGLAANQAASKVLLQRKRFSEALQFAIGARNLRPADLRSNCQYAICRLLEAFPAEGIEAISTLNSALHEAAAEAVTVFAGQWPNARDASDEHLIVQVAHFYVMALTVLGRTNDAIQVLASVPDSIQSELLMLWHARFALVRGEPEVALELLRGVADPDLLEESYWLQLQAAEANNEIDEALRVIDELSAVVRSNFRLERLQHHKATLLLNGRTDEALTAVARLGEGGASPNAKIYAANVLGKLGEAEAADALIDSALEAISAGASVDRYAALLAAGFAVQRGRPATAVKCLEWAANSANDNAALRLLLRSLAQLGHWKRVEAIVAALPELFKHDPYYVEIEARRFAATGQADKALVLLGGYGDPSDRSFSLAVARLQLLVRLDRTGEARAAAGGLLRKAVAALAGEGARALQNSWTLPTALRQLVDLGRSLGHDLLAVQVATLSLSVFVGQPAIELMYVFDARRREQLQALSWSDGSFVGVELADGRIANVCVCHNGLDLTRFLAQFPLAYSLSTTQASELGLLNATLGRHISVDTADGSLVGAVKEIGELHAALSRLILNTFEERYPGQRVLEMVTISQNAEDPPDLSAIYRLLDGIEERHQLALEGYQNYAVPLIFVADCFSMVPVELWQQIVTAPGRWFYSWGGALDDLTRQVASLQESPPIVIEPLTLVTWWRTGKLDLFMRLAGRILVAPSSLDVVQELIETVAKRRNTLGSLGKVGTQYVRHDTDPHEIAETLDNLQKLKVWIETYCEIIAVAADTSDDETVSAIYQVSPPTAHALKLAQQESALLWVDDLRLAHLSEQNSWAKCVCWHVILEALALRNKANEDEYVEALAIAASANYTFVHVRVKALCAAAKADHLAVGWKTRALLKAFRQEVHFPSAMLVLLEFLAKMALPSRCPSLLLNGYVRIGLSAITRDATRYVHDALQVIANISELAAAVDEWKRGHFIHTAVPSPLPNQHWSA